MFEEIYKGAQIVNIITVVLCLQMCVEVVRVWKDEAVSFLSGHKEPWLWIGFAVTLHYATEFVDGAYWGTMWAADYAENPLAAVLNKYGIFSNIPFRQIGTTVSAYCYLKAGALYLGCSMENIHKRMLMAVLLGIILAAVL